MTQTVSLEPGDEFDLHIGPIRKRIGENEIPMLAYNGSVPGPTLRVRQLAHERPLGAPYVPVQLR